MQSRRGMFRSLMHIFCAMMLCLALASTAFGQSSLGSVRGAVRDQSGAVIPLAKLDLVNKATNVTLHAETNESGQYAFPAVLPGQYTLTVTFAGMETLQVGLEVQVQVSTTFNAVLKAGGTETKITVSAELTPLTTTDSPMLGHVLERQRIEQLPLNGRDIQQLLVTVPGLELSTANQVRSWGMMAGAHQYILDGAVLEESMWAEGTIVRPPGLETIQEFKVENNASSAKFTRMTSIIMSTKSGTNKLHGALFEANRDNSYGKARSRTDLVVNAQGKTEFPVLSRHEYGGNLGGPVWIPKLYNGKDRTFFFFGYEGFRRNSPSTMSGNVPTAAMRNGDFSGLVDSQGRVTTIYDPWTTNTTTWARQPLTYGGKFNAIDPSRISPVAKYAFSVIPQASFPDRNPLLDSNWTGPAANKGNEYTLTSRVDHQFSPNDQTYVRFNNGHSLRTVLGAGGGCYPATDGVSCYYDDDSINRSAAGNWVHTFSPTMFNEVMVSYSHNWRTQLTGEPGKNYIDALGLPNPFNKTGFPTINNIGMGPASYLRPINYILFNHNSLILEDNGTKLMGRHELQFGAHLRFDFLDTVPQQVSTTGIADFATGATTLYDPNTSRTAPQGTSFTGNNTANLFLGVANYQARLRKGMFNLRRGEHSFYFQDNFKVTSRFTLNLGIRWQLSPFVKSADGIAVPGFDKANHAVVLSQPVDKLYAAGVTLPSIINAYANIGVKYETWDQAKVPQSMGYSSWRDWSPHVGFAYRAFDGPKSFVLRGGLRKSYFTEGIWTWMDQSSANTPFTANFNNYALTDSSQSPDGIGSYGMRSVPTIVAGLNSKNAVDVTNLGTSITPGSTYNYFFNPKQPTDYVYDWNLTLEKDVSSNSMIRIGYVGNHSGNQMEAYAFNENPPTYVWYMTARAQPPTGALSAVARRPYDKTTYGTLNEYLKSGWSNYNGIQATFERRYSKGYGFQIMYVVGNAFRAGGSDSAGGYASGVADANQYMPGAVPTDYDQRNRFLNYRRDTSNMPKHRVRWNYVVDLPFGKGKPIGRNAGGILNGIIGGWQIASMGTIWTTYTSLGTGNWVNTGEPIHYYGYEYPIQNCTSVVAGSATGGQCYPGYLWTNGYLPSNKINSKDPVTGRPNGYMGVPANYKPYQTPLIPWGSTTLPPNAPANTNISTYWDTNNVWIPLLDGTVQRTTYGELHPYRNQFFGGPRQWNQDASLYKRFIIREGTELRFNFDAFNVTNHPNNSGGGTILSTQGQSNAARQLQLAVRLTW